MKDRIIMKEQASYPFVLYMLKNGGLNDFKCHKDVAGLIMSNKLHFS